MESGGFDYHIVFHSIPFLAKGMVLTLVLTEKDGLHFDRHAHISIPSSAGNGKILGS